MRAGERHMATRCWIIAVCLATSLISLGEEVGLGPRLATATHCPEPFEDTPEDEPCPRDITNATFAVAATPYSGFAVAGGVGASMAGACMANGLATDPVRFRTFRRAAGGISVVGLLALVALLAGLAPEIVVGLSAVALLGGGVVFILAWMAKKPTNEESSA